jgi:enterochelin esterase family protein
MSRRWQAAAYVAAFTIGMSALAAQTPAPPPAAAPGARAGGPQGGRGGGAVKSPEVAGGRVTFRLRAPEAREVLANIAGKRIPLQKTDQGVWEGTTDALAADYYTYSLIVDGNAINDPSNRQVQTSFGSFQSMVVVPGPEPWFPAAGVARGAITKHTFHSAVANDDRDFYVYTPAGYDAHRSQPYPVFYLLHGLGDDAERWMNGGAANVILDNLIAQGKAAPMVLVTTLGYGVSNGPAGAMAPESITGYTKILLDEVMPRVDTAYNVSRNREQRAIAGLSMGGAETLYTALNHLDKFAWIGSFSGAFVMWPGATSNAARGAGRGPAAAAAPAATAPAAPPAGAPGMAGPDAAAGAAPARGGRGGGRGGAQTIDASVLPTLFPTLDAKANSQIRMLWIVCGTADSLIGVNRQFKDWLKTKNVRFTEQEVPDMAHVWPLWRQNFTDMAQKVFKKG